ncbi:MAG: hypothetical protein JRI61_04330 [Deltaproteobacteria bacterium]|nr:hypothetical protein [Deltaproteobacteria bacterium]
MKHPHNLMKELYNYNVKCRTCRSLFQVQLFESHEKNLFLVDKKDWYCETCKKKYFSQQTKKLTDEQKVLGFQDFEGSPKSVSWAVKIRGELINKVNYLRQSLTFENNDEKVLSEKAFAVFLAEWQKETDAKWWIDHRKMTVRDISKRIQEISETIQK